MSPERPNFSFSGNSKYKLIFAALVAILSLFSWANLLSARDNSSYYQNRKLHYGSIPFGMPFRETFFESYRFLEPVSDSVLTSHTSLPYYRNNAPIPHFSDNPVTLREEDYLEEDYVAEHTPRAELYDNGIPVVVLNRYFTNTCGWDAFYGQPSVNNPVFLSRRAIPVHGDDPVTEMRLYYLKDLRRMEEPELFLLKKVIHVESNIPAHTMENPYGELKNSISMKMGIPATNHSDYHSGHPVTLASWVGGPVEVFLLDRSEDGILEIVYRSRNLWRNFTATCDRWHEGPERRTDYLRQKDRARIQHVF